MERLVPLAIGVTLTIALLLGLTFSCFVVAVIVASQKYKSASNLLLLQLGIADALLALFGLILSVPSLMQGKWLVPTVLTPDFSEGLVERLQQDALNSSDFSNSSSSIYDYNLYEASQIPLEENDTFSYFGTAEPSDYLVEGSTSSNISYNNILTELNGAYDRVNSDNYIDSGILCRLYGGVLILFNVACVWLVVGLHCDKYCAIASPLRYNQIVTKKRMALYSQTVWMTSAFLSLLVTLLAPEFKYVGGVCLPVWQKVGEIVYTFCVALVLTVSPIVLFIVLNGKIILIARMHQQRIFYAIFEVMMSAQATVTQQRNPFDIPKKKQKSTWRIVEQMIGFIVCYCPLLFYMLLGFFDQYKPSDVVELITVGTLLLAPFMNSFLYGMKSTTIRRLFKNYLRKKISKSAMKCEIQARIPSAQNSRRPSLSSTFGFPILHKTLERRMSDYLCADMLPNTEVGRRSSDLSWHPLEEGTPTSSRLRQPLDIDLGNEWFTPQDLKGSQHLTVPSYDVARTLSQATSAKSRFSSSLDSLESDAMKDLCQEEDATVTNAELYTQYSCDAKNDQDETVDEVNSSNMSVSEEEISLPNGNVHHLLSVTVPIYRRASSAISSVTSDDSQTANSTTPLLCRAYMQPWPKAEPSNTNSPYIIRTLESLMAVGLSQSRLLKNSYLLRGNSVDKNNGSIKKKIRIVDDCNEGKTIELKDKKNRFISSNEQGLEGQIELTKESSIIYT